MFGYGSVKVKSPVFDDVAAALKKGEDVVVPNFGKWKIKKVPAKPRRRGRNPFTGQEQWFKAKPASKKIKFFPAKKLKDKI